MLLKNILPLIYIFCVHNSAAQKTIFSDGFEDKQVDSIRWQNVTGNWRVEGVDDLRIAPAENGYRYVLCSGGKDYVGDQIIRLIIDLPDSLEPTKIKLSFSYYILADVSGTKIEAEFYEKEIKDGRSAPLWVDFLHRAKGRWKDYRQTLNIPAKANVAYITFFGLKSSGVKDRIVCFDNIVISALK
jgi:hypothetical protein